MRNNLSKVTEDARAGGQTLVRLHSVAAEQSWTKVLFAASDAVRHSYAPTLREAGYDVVELTDCSNLVTELLAGQNDEDNPRDIDLLIVHGSMAGCLAQSGIFPAHLTLPPVIWIAANCDGEHLVVEILPRVAVIPAGCAPSELLEVAQRVVPAEAT